MDAPEQEMHDRQFPIEEDIVQQRQIWRFERIGWYALLVIVLLTLCGLFSHGPLSSTQAVSAQQDLSVEYERFHRSGAVNSMVVRAKGKAGQPLTLFISEAMLDGFSVESMQPQPLSSSAGRHGLRLTLAADEQGEAALYLTWRSDGIGLFKSRIGIEGGGQVSLSQFIYP
jgi:hypothetical protein